MLQNAYNILVVEPDDNWFSTIYQILDKTEFKIIRALTSKQAISHCKKGYIHLIILEHKLEGNDGIELTTEIRESLDLRQLPVIFFSEVSDKYTQIAAFEAGADMFLWKGMKSRVFLAQVNAFLRRCYEIEERASEKKVLGAIEIDEDKVVVYKHGELIELSKKEFELLLLLTSKPGKVFKRPSILSKIWGNDIIVGDRNIDTHIKKLRKKIGKEYIKTARGIGYKFNQV